jgi:hypothetical protein
MTHCALSEEDEGGGGYYVHLLIYIGIVATGIMTLSYPLLLGSTVATGKR